MVFQRTKSNVSGMDYCPLTPCLRPADVPLTMPLTLVPQEGSRATENEGAVIPFAHPQIAGLVPEQRIFA
jgi:hypothetical protein